MKSERQSLENIKHLQLVKFAHMIKKWFLVPNIVILLKVVVNIQFRWVLYSYNLTPIQKLGPFLISLIGYYWLASSMLFHVPAPMQ